MLAGSSLDRSSQSLAWDLSAIEGKPPTGYIWPGWAAYAQLASLIHTFPKLEVGVLEREEAAGIARGLQITKQFLGRRCLLLFFSVEIRLMLRFVGVC